jgi:hypothetical protein
MYGNTSIYKLPCGSISKEGTSHHLLLSQPETRKLACKTFYNVTCLFVFVCHFLLLYKICIIAKGDAASFNFLMNSQARSSASGLWDYEQDFQTLWNNALLPKTRVLKVSASAEKRMSLLQEMQWTQLPWGLRILKVWQVLCQFIVQVKMSCLRNTRSIRFIMWSQTWWITIWYFIVFHVYNMYVYTIYYNMSMCASPESWAISVSNLLISSVLAHPHDTTLCIYTYTYIHIYIYTHELYIYDKIIINYIYVCV